MIRSSQSNLQRAQLLNVTNNRGHLYFYLSLLIIQFLLYTRVVYNAFDDPKFHLINGVKLPKHWSELRVNHIGNISILHSSPAMFWLLIHAIMAWIWVTGILVMLFLIRKMSQALMSNNVGYYNFYSRLHVILGTFMCLIALIGCVAGIMMAYKHHNHPSMRQFLMWYLPCFFIPSILIAWFTAKWGKLVNHRFWSTIAFVAPALTSLIAELFIYICGRHTPLGPWTGELVGTGSGAIFGFIVVVIPAIYLRLTENSTLMTKSFHLTNTNRIIIDLGLFILMGLGYIMVHLELNLNTWQLIGLISSVRLIQLFALKALVQAKSSAYGLNRRFILAELGVSIGQLLLVIDLYLKLTRCESMRLISLLGSLLSLLAFESSFDHKSIDIRHLIFMVSFVALISIE